MNHSRGLPVGATTAASTRKGVSTRQAIVDEALRLITVKGVEAASILQVTRNLGVSNGLFYYHFRNLDHLLEEAGDTVVTALVGEIQSAPRDDIAARIARGPLVILRYADRNPGLLVIMLRVIDDPEGLHPGISARLREDIVKGRIAGRFTVGDIDLAVQFCRSLVGSAVLGVVRGRHFYELGPETATLTLSMLGLQRAEAEKIVAKELAILNAEPFGR